jgi:hypothetical protein
VDLVAATNVKTGQTPPSTANCSTGRPPAGQPRRCLVAGVSAIATMAMTATATSRTARIKPAWVRGYGPRRLGLTPADPHRVDQGDVAMAAL